MTFIMPECGFCKQDAELRNSHVLPAFVFKWLKSRSTGHIRNSDNPNVRVQDGVKMPWLCANCEKLFSVYETKFATLAFHPWLKGERHIQYADWLLKFCVSVSWRVLNYCKGYNPDKIYTDEEEIAIRAADDRWRKFLNGDVPHPGAFQQHLVIFDVIEETTVPNMPTNMNRFLLGAITMDIVGSDRTLMTYAKLGRFCIFGLIRSNPKEWEGTKVHVRNGILKPGKVVLPYGLMHLFNEKAALANIADMDMSATQRKKIDRSVEQNLEKLMQSEQFDAMLADARMFGVGSITSKT
jgi:hypothetical protein